jgi:hypothetical protein
MVGACQSRSRRRGGSRLGRRPGHIPAGGVGRRPGRLWHSLPGQPGSAGTHVARTGCTRLTPPTQASPRPCPPATFSRDLMTEPLCIGLDAGGSGVRAMLGTVDGAILARGNVRSTDQLAGSLGRRRLVKGWHAVLTPLAEAAASAHGHVVCQGVTPRAAPAHLEWKRLRRAPPRPTLRVYPG